LRRAQLGAESIVEGGILSIAKKVGDYVAAEEMVAEIETGARTLARCAIVSGGGFRHGFRAHAPSRALELSARSPRPSVRRQGDDRGQVSGGWHHQGHPH
jgi:hypothetical protein